MINKFINIVPKVELHIHLEGTIDNNIIQKMGGTIITSSNPFNIFNNNIQILCNNFYNNINILLLETFKNRLTQNIFYTQYHYSALKIMQLTTLNVQQQFDIIINCINNIKKNSIYQYIYIDFILDIPRGNAYIIYPYFKNGDYFNEIITLINNENKEYNKYIRGVGIGGRDENNTIEHYKIEFDKILKQNIPIIPHAGEFGPTHVTCNSIKIALQYSNRLGHGVRILECTDITKKPVLDISITSNLIFINDVKYTKNTHPIKDLIKKDYPITLSTDDPGLLYRLDDPQKNIDLLYEYNLLIDILGTSYSIPNKFKIITKIILNGIDNINNYTNKNNIFNFLLNIKNQKIIEVVLLYKEYINNIYISTPTHFIDSNEFNNLLIFFDCDLFVADNYFKNKYKKYKSKYETLKKET